VRDFAEQAAELFAQGFQPEFFVVEGVALSVVQAENGCDSFSAVLCVVADYVEYPGVGLFV